MQSVTLQTVNLKYISVTLVIICSALCKMHFSYVQSLVMQYLQCCFEWPTLQTVFKTSSVVSPGCMTARMGWLFGKHTQEGFRYSGTQISLSTFC